MTGENDAPTVCIELRPHPQAHLVGLPAKQLRVNRLHEGVHAIETLWCRAGRQPFEVAVGTRDIAVRAGRDVDDDFATRHGGPPNGSRLSCSAEHESSQMEFYHRRRGAVSFRRMMGSTL